MRVISVLDELPASSVTVSFSLPGSESLVPDEITFPSNSRPALQVLETSSFQVATVFVPILSSLVPSVTSCPPMTLTEERETEMTGALVSMVGVGGVGGVGSIGSLPPQATNKTTANNQERNLMENGFIVLILPDGYRHGNF